MKMGGWLDGFPLHLFFGRDPGPRGPVVCLGSGALGSVQMGSSSGSVPTVLVYEDSDSAASGPDTELFRVVADRSFLPFRNASLSRCVDVRPGGVAVDREESTERDRVLSDDSVFVQISDRAMEASPPVASLRVTRFEVRPRTGPEYFVNRTPAPRRSPFRKLQLAKPTALREQLPSWLHVPGTTSLLLEVRSNQPTSMDDDWPVGSDFGLFVKANWNALLIGDERSVLKFPLLAEGADRLRAQADQLAQVRRELPASRVELVPEPIDDGVRSGQFYLRESVRPGRPIPLGWWKPNWARISYHSAADFLIDCHRETAGRDFADHQPEDGVSKLPRPGAGEALGPEEVDALLASRLETVVRSGREVDVGFSLDEFDVCLRERLIGQHIPLVRTHGDFWGGNLLVDSAGGLTGVLDWDASNPQGWPLIDLFHLLTYRKKRRAYWKFGDVVTNWLLPEKWASWETELVDRYCEALHLNREQRQTLKGVYWLERVYQWWLTNSSEAWMDRDWIRRNIVEIAPKLVYSLTP